MQRQSQITKKKTLCLWLVDLRTRQEQNCLIRYALAAGVPEDWYWHDGKIKIFTRIIIITLLIVNSLETKGVFMHAKDNTEAEWINDWSCSADKTFGYMGGDYINFGIWFKTYPHLTGFWCDRASTTTSHFICESLI